jgi:hypothetical protein
MNEIDSLKSHTDEDLIKQMQNFDKLKENYCKLE